MILIIFNVSIWNKIIVKFGIWLESDFDSRKQCCGVIKYVYVCGFVVRIIWIFENYALLVVQGWAVFNVSSRDGKTRSPTTKAAACFRAHSSPGPILQSALHCNLGQPSTYLQRIINYTFLIKSLKFGRFKSS